MVTTPAGLWTGIVGSIPLAGEDSLYPEHLHSLHRQAIERAPETLTAFSSEPAVLTDQSVPMRFSTSRGGLPVLVPPALLAPGIDVDRLPVNVVANGGAQLQNSGVFLDGQSALAREIVLRNAEATAHTMLAYSRPGDTFVYYTSNEPASRAILGRIADSYASIGIETSRIYESVPSIGEWLDRHSGRELILPNVIEPLSLIACAADEQQVRPLIRSGMANIAAYTKDGAELTWRNHGVPTPLTHYYDGRLQSCSEISRDVSERFADYDHVVLSRLDGSGGFGIELLSRQAITTEIVEIWASNQPVQVQGYLKLDGSPCLIANISPERVEVLAASEQRFSRFGTHAGNHWDRRYFEALSREVPGLEDISVRALDELRKVGVIGQINIDLMIVAEEAARIHGLGSRALLREANIRPAGSSIILRMRDGRLRNNSIERIVTNTATPMSESQVLGGDVQRLAETLSKPGRTGVVLANFNPRTLIGTLAYLGAPGVKEEELRLLEVEMQARLKS